MSAILLVEIAVKATLVLMSGLALTRLMSRASAASRHLVWVLTLSAALAVPAMHLAGPAWTLAVLPAEDPMVEGAPAFAVQSSSEPAPLARLEARVPEDGAEVPALAATPARSPEPSSRRDWQWGTMAVWLWLVGAGLMLIRLVAGITWAGVMVRRALYLPHTGWLDSLDEAAAVLGLSRRVDLKVSAHVAVPMATGLFRSSVLLPPAAIDWPEERRRVVLQHELAHILRRDCLLQVLAQCVCAVHWFNPAAHVAASRLRAEQERACDDLVIEGGTDARSYADHLFEIARSFRAASFPTWVAMSMARPSQLEGRMLAILDDARVRCAPSRRVRVALLAGMLVVALPFGALRLGAQTGTHKLPGAFAAQGPPASFGGSPVALGTDAVASVSSGSAVPSVPVVDIVHGTLTNADVLEPRWTDFDAVAAGTFDMRWDQGVDARAILNGSTGQQTSRLMAAQARGGVAVSDDTRKRVADALMSALNDDNPQVRQEALSSLAAMRDERAIPGLVRALGDSSAEVRMRALGALSQFESMAAADGVLTALKDSNADVREQAARQLAVLVGRGRLSDPKYVDALSDLLRDANADVREQAVAALGRLRAPSAAGSLGQALKDSSPDVRRQAARALGQLGNADAVPSLTPLLQDADRSVRAQAASALGAIADPRAIDPLTASLKDSDPSVREQAARALGQIARGQRRGIRVEPPPPPPPPAVPRAFVDEDRIREITERAREAAARAQRDVRDQLRDLDLRFDFPILGDVPRPEPAPTLPVPPLPSVR